MLQEDVSCNDRLHQVCPIEAVYAIHAENAILSLNYLQVVLVQCLSLVKTEFNFAHKAILLLYNVVGDHEQLAQILIFWLGQFSVEIEPGVLEACEIRPAIIVNFSELFT